MLFIEYSHLKERFENKFNLSPLTVKNYISQLKKFENLDISDIDEIEDELFNNYTLSNYKNMIIALLKYLNLDQIHNQDIIEKYQHYLDDVEEQLINASDLVNEKTQKEQDKWIRQGELQLVFNEYENKIDKYQLFEAKYFELKKYDKTLLTDFVVLSLFTLLPPRRAKDYALMHVIDQKYYDPKDTRINWIVTRKNKPLKFVFNNYKTSKKFGQQNIEINNRKLILILKKYFITRGYDGRNMIFILNTNGVKNKLPYKKRITADSLSLKIKNIFKKSYLDKKINLNILRHSFISETIGTTEIEKMNIRKQLAYEMAHGLSTQLNYIRF